MGKSSGNAIYLADDAGTVRGKVMVMVTDPRLPNRLLYRPG